MCECSNNCLEPWQMNAVICYKHSNCSESQTHSCNCCIIQRCSHVTFCLQGRYFGPSLVTREGEFPAVTSNFPCSRSASGSTYPNSSSSQSDVSYSLTYLANVLGTKKWKTFWCLIVQGIWWRRVLTLSK